GRGLQIRVERLAFATGRIADHDRNRPVGCDLHSVGREAGLLRCVDGTCEIVVAPGPLSPAGCARHRYHRLGSDGEARHRPFRRERWLVTQELRLNVNWGRAFLSRGVPGRHGHPNPPVELTYADNEGGGAYSSSDATARLAIQFK